MEGRVSSAFAEILADRRSVFNARFQAVRQMNRHVSGPDFLRHLEKGLGPVVDRCARLAPDQAGEVTETLFEISLALFAGGFLGTGSQYALVDALWKDVLPGIGHLLVQAPGKLGRALSNAAIHLAAEKTVHKSNWLQLLQDLGYLCPEPELYLQTGFVAAWKCGMACYRDPALVICRSLPARILIRIFDLDPGADPKMAIQAIAAMENDPWHVPQKSRPKTSLPFFVADRVGGFRGFGGLFISPPEVAVLKQGLFVYDAQKKWRVFADGFGVSLRIAGKGPPRGDKTRDSAFKITPQGKVVKNGRSAVFAHLSGARSQAATGDTLLVCPADSHYVMVIACPGEAGADG